MDKRIIVVNGIVLANTKRQAISQFNTFCKGTPESCHNKDNIWFVKCCKASPVKLNSLSLTSSSTILRPRKMPVSSTRLSSLGKSLPPEKSKLNPIGGPQWDAYSTCSNVSSA